MASIVADTLAFQACDAAPTTDGTDAAASNHQIATIPDAAPMAEGAEHAADAAPTSDAQPKPDYDEHTTFPAPCYFPDCKTKYKGASMGLLLNHVKTVHKVKMEDIDGTYLAIKGREDFQAWQHARRANGPPANEVGRG